jgi:two-component system, OmpR family, phosphate regulon sensor histidine kinase PhoR
LKNNFSGAKGRLFFAIVFLVILSMALLGIYLKRFDPITLIVVGLFIFFTWVLIKWATAPLIDSLKQLQNRLILVAKGEYGQKISPVPRNESEKVVRAFNETSLIVGEVLERSVAERDRFSIVLTHMADGIFVLDHNSSISLVNKSAEHMFKLSAETAEGHSFIETVHDAEMYQLVKLCLESGQQQSGFVETRTRRMYLGVVATPLQNNEGCILLIQDLTEIRRLETVRRDFVANISHELRTPIASLKALSETLNAGAIEDPSVARDFLTRIEVEADKLNQMTHELSELSNIESGVTSLLKTSVDVKDLIAEATERLRAQVKRAGLEIAIEVPKVVPAALIDKNRMERVLVNLIHNSIKFTPPGGRITLSASSGDEGVIISVADTGVGIDPSDLPRIFERFYKADKARTGGGTGLGLAIARHTVEAHGGRIWAESTLGKGTTIHFSLPILSNT